MIIIADSSPLICFSILDKLSILDAIFDNVFVPEEVYNEATVPSKPYSDMLQEYLQGKVKKVSNTLAVNMLSYEVDPGEAEAIVLALEENIQRVFIDDKKGRRAARKEGLKPIGTIGVLLLAKEKGLIPEIKPCLDILLDNEIRFGEALYNSALEKAREN